MAQLDTALLRPAGTRSFRTSLPVRLAAGALLAAGAAGAYFLASGSGTNAPPRAPAASASQAAFLVEATARQLDAEGTVRLDAARTRLGVSAEGERLVYRMRIDGTPSAADVAAIRAQDAASVCAGVDSSRLVTLGGSFEHRYADARGKSFSSVVTSCPGGGASARSPIPVSM